MKRFSVSSMPVTHEISKQVGNSFENTIIIHVNHLLNDILDLNEYLILSKAKLIFVPIIYGDKDIPSDLSYDIIYIRSEGGGFSLYVNNENIKSVGTNFRKATQVAVEHSILLALDQMPKNVLLIEDGGYHLESLASLNSHVNASLYVGSVEQTTSGIRLVQNYVKNNGALPYPILSLSRSKIKTRFENYFIAQRVIEELSLHLYELDEFLTLRYVTVIGYGTSGRAISHLLRKLDCTVSIIESNPNIMVTAKSEGFFPISDINPEIFNQNSLFLGTTGTSSFTLDMLAAFLSSSSKKLYLASASSKRLEFASVINFFENNEEYRQNLCKSYMQLTDVRAIDIHKTKAGLTYTFDYKNERRAIILIAEGYPTNFYRAGSQSLPASVCDVINAEVLLLAKYLLDSHAKLDNKLYLLGYDHLSDFPITEEDILKLWFSNNFTDSSFGDDPWTIFEPHPNEKELILGKLDNIK